MKNPFNLTEEERLKEWAEIEEIVLTYQRYHNSNIIEEELMSKEAADILRHRFSPLLKKYLSLVKYGQLDFNDIEQKQFVTLFMDDISLKRALGRKKQSNDFKSAIHSKFNFVPETYGKKSEEDILSDLYLCLLIIARRYKQTGKNFCGYIYNVFKYEVSRFIKDYTKNPGNISYKNFQYEDCMNGNTDNQMKAIYEDNYYETVTGLPDLTWIKGQHCGDAFNPLTDTQRKILIKYYLEDFNDKQIADMLGTYVSVINCKRREAVNILCDYYDIEPSTLKRMRNSGRKANIPTK